MLRQNFIPELWRKSCKKFCVKLRVLAGFQRGRGLLCKNFGAQIFGEGGEEARVDRGQRIGPMTQIRIRRDNRWCGGSSFRERCYQGTNSGFNFYWNPRGQRSGRGSVRGRFCKLQLSLSNLNFSLSI